MTDLNRAVQPEVRNLSVLAYELNSLALAVAAEAATLARGRVPTPGDGHDGDGEVLAAEMNDLIRRLQEGTRAMRIARRRGTIPRV